MAIQLLLVVAVILSCVLLNKMARKVGVPALLAFILLGMVFGVDGPIGIRVDDPALIGDICSVALLFVMFCGGFGTSWRHARPTAVRSIVLSTVGVAVTAGLTGAFCHFALGLGWTQGLLVGSTLSSTDAASVFSILRSRRLNLTEGTASLLEVESGSNDPMAFMLTAIFVSRLADPMGTGETIAALALQMGLGLGLGAVVARAAAWALRTRSFEPEGIDMVFVLGVAVLAYALPLALGGNGYLAAYVAGIVLGNSPFKDKPRIVHFFDGVLSLAQMLIFFLLGLVATPSGLPAVIVPALATLLFLTLVARPVAVFALLAPLGSSARQMGLVSFAGLRGAASIVFAVQAFGQDPSAGGWIVDLTFIVVLISMLAQGSLLAPMAQALGMVSDDADVMRTFTDYTERVPVRLIECPVPEGHGWVGRSISQLDLPPRALIVLVGRGDGRFVPNGSTVLEAGDRLVLGAITPASTDEVSLSEMVVEAGGAYAGRTIAELDDLEGGLVMMVQRGERTIIPNGKTMLEVGDVLVFGQTAG